MNGLEVEQAYFFGLKPSSSYLASLSQSKVAANRPSFIASIGLDVDCNELLFVLSLGLVEQLPFSERA